MSTISPLENLQRISQDLSNIEKKINNPNLKIDPVEVISQLKGMSGQLFFIGKQLENTKYERSFNKVDTIWANCFHKVEMIQAVQITNKNN